MPMTYSQTCTYEPWNDMLMTYLDALLRSWKGIYTCWLTYSNTYTIKVTEDILRYLLSLLRSWKGVHTCWLTYSNTYTIEVMKGHAYMLIYSNTFIIEAMEGRTC